MFNNIVSFVKQSIAWGKAVAGETGGKAAGTPSASRVVALLITTTVVGVLIAHVHMNHGLPSSSQLYGLSALVAAGAGAYATNKIRRDSNGGDDNDSNGGNNAS